jgi:hypothetical protein
LRQTDVPWVARHVVGGGLEDAFVERELVAGDPAGQRGLTVLRSDTNSGQSNLGVFSRDLEPQSPEGGLSSSDEEHLEVDFRAPRDFDRLRHLKRSVREERDG